MGVHSIFRLQGTKIKKLTHLVNDRVVILNLKQW